MEKTVILPRLFGQPARHHGRPVTSRTMPTADNVKSPEVTSTSLESNVHVLSGGTSDKSNRDRQNSGRLACDALVSSTTDLNCQMSQTGKINKSSGCNNVINVPRKDIPPNGSTQRQVENPGQLESCIDLTDDAVQYSVISKTYPKTTAFVLLSSDDDESGDSKVQRKLEPSKKQLTPAPLPPQKQLLARVLSDQRTTFPAAVEEPKEIARAVNKDKGTGKTPGTSISGDKATTKFQIISIDSDEDEEDKKDLAETDEEVVIIREEFRGKMGSEQRKAFMRSTTSTDVKKAAVEHTEKPASNRIAKKDCSAISEALHGTSSKVKSKPEASSANLQGSPATCDTETASKVGTGVSGPPVAFVIGPGPGVNLGVRPQTPAQLSAPLQNFPKPCRVPILICPTVLAPQRHAMPVQINSSMSGQIGDSILCAEPTGPLQPTNPQNVPIAASFLVPFQMIISQSSPVPLPQSIPLNSQSRALTAQSGSNTANAVENRQGGNPKSTTKRSEESSRRVEQGHAVQGSVTTSSQSQRRAQVGPVGTVMATVNKPEVQHVYTAPQETAVPRMHQQGSNVSHSHQEVIGLIRSIVGGKNQLHVTRGRKEKLMGIVEKGKHLPPNLVSITSCATKSDKIKKDDNGEKTRVDKSLSLSKETNLNSNEHHTQSLTNRGADLAQKRGGVSATGRDPDKDRVDKVLHRNANGQFAVPSPTGPSTSGDPGVLSLNSNSLVAQTVQTQTVQGDVQHVMDTKVDGEAVPPEQGQGHKATPVTPLGWVVHIKVQERHTENATKAGGKKVQSQQNIRGKRSMDINTSELLAHYPLTTSILCILKDILNMQWCTEQSKNNTFTQIIIGVIQSGTYVGKRVEKVDLKLEVLLDKLLKPNNEGFFRCPQCVYVSENYTLLSQHLITFHPMVQVYCCCLCGRVTLNRKNFIKHCETKAHVHYVDEALKSHAQESDTGDCVTTCYNSDYLCLEDHPHVPLDTGNTTSSGPAHTGPLEKHPRIPLDTGNMTSSGPAHTGRLEKHPRVPLDTGNTTSSGPAHTGRLEKHPRIPLDSGNTTSSGPAHTGRLEKHPRVPLDTGNTTSSGPAHTGPLEKHPRVPLDTRNTTSSGPAHTGRLEKHPRVPLDTGNTTSSGPAHTAPFLLASDTTMLGALVITRDADQEGPLKAADSFSKQKTLIEANSLIPSNDSSMEVPALASASSSKDETNVYPIKISAVVSMATRTQEDLDDKDNLRKCVEFGQHGTQEIVDSSVKETGDMDMESLPKDYTLVKIEPVDLEISYDDTALRDQDILRSGSPCLPGSDDDDDAAKVGQESMDSCSSTHSLRNLLLCESSLARQRAKYHDVIQEKQSEFIGDEGEHDTLQDEDKTFTPKYINLFPIDTKNKPEGSGLDKKFKNKSNRRRGQQRKHSTTERANPDKRPSNKKHKEPKAKPETLKRPARESLPKVSPTSKQRKLREQKDRGKELVNDLSKSPSNMSPARKQRNLKDKKESAKRLRGKLKTSNSKILHQRSKTPKFEKSQQKSKIAGCNKSHTKTQTTTSKTSQKRMIGTRCRTSSAGTKTRSGKRYKAAKTEKFTRIQAGKIMRSRDQSKPGDPSKRSVTPLEASTSVKGSLPSNPKDGKYLKTYANYRKYSRRLIGDTVAVLPKDMVLKDLSIPLIRNCVVNASLVVGSSSKDQNSKNIPNAQSPSSEKEEQSVATPQVQVKSAENSSKRTPSAMLVNYTSETLYAELERRRTLTSCGCGISFKDRGLYFIHKCCHNSQNLLICTFCHYTAKNFIDFHSHFFNH